MKNPLLQSTTPPREGATYTRNELMEHKIPCWKSDVELSVPCLHLEHPLDGDMTADRMDICLCKHKMMSVFNFPSVMLTIDEAPIVCASMLRYINQANISLPLKCPADIDIASANEYILLQGRWNVIRYHETVFKLLSALVYARTIMDSDAPITIDGVHPVYRFDWLGVKRKSGDSTNYISDHPSDPSSDHPVREYFDIYVEVAQRQDCTRTTLLKIAKHADLSTAETRYFISSGKAPTKSIARKLQVFLDGQTDLTFMNQFRGKSRFEGVKW